MTFSGDPAIGCDPDKEFDCGGDGTMCIPLDRVCDRKNDCGTWEDEPKDLCHLNECLGEAALTSGKANTRYEDTNRLLTLLIFE